MKINEPKYRVETEGNQEDLNRFVLSYLFNIYQEKRMDLMDLPAGMYSIGWAMLSPLKRRKMDLLEETSPDQRLMMIVELVKHRFHFSALVRICGLCFSSNQRERNEPNLCGNSEKENPFIVIVRDFFSRDIDESIQPFYTSLPSTK